MVNGVMMALAKSYSLNGLNPKQGNRTVIGYFGGGGKSKKA